MYSKHETLVSIRRKLWRYKILIAILIILAFVLSFFYVRLLFYILLGILIFLIVSAAIAIIYFLIKFRIPDVPWTEQDGLKYDNLNYAEGPNNNYELYIPNSIKNKKHISLVLYIHGGAWKIGDKNLHSGDCRTLAKEGYITASMNYSLLTGKPDTPTILQMVTEIEQCINHICDFTNKRGYNIEQMAIGGASAGSHLAMLFTYMKKYNIGIPIKFILNRVGPSDFNAIYRTDANKLEKIQNSNGKLSGDLKDEKSELDDIIYFCSGQKYEVGSYDKEEVDNLISTSSPLKYINQDTIVPSLLAYGGKDFLVEKVHYEELVDKYKNFNCEYELILFPNSGHTLSDDPEEKQRYENAVLAWCKKYFDE